MATTPLVLRNYRESKLAQLGTVAVQYAPTAGRWLRRAARRARSAVLQVGGLGMITYAAWLVAVPLGLVVGGVCLLLLEPATAPDDEAPR